MLILCKYLTDSDIINLALLATYLKFINTGLVKYSQYSLRIIYDTDINCKVAIKITLASEIYFKAA